MGKKYKIVYSRDVCIGAGSCVAINPNVWELDDENKAVLKGGKKNPQAGMWELEIDEKDFKINIDAARSCPVLAIDVMDGKKSLVKG